MENCVRREDLERRLELIEKNWVGLNKDIHQVAAFVAGEKGGTIELNSTKSNKPEEMD